MTSVPTLEEVARVAGVSRATVSRVVNGSPKVTPGVREAVEAAIDRLGYVPNRAARSLVTRRTDSIALVVTETDELLFSNPFFGTLTAGFARAAAGADRQLVLLMGQARDDLMRAERFLQTGAVDGAAFTSLHRDDEVPARLDRAGVPVAIGGRPFSHPGLAHVDVDNVGGARSAVRALLAAGRRRIATITGPPDMNSAIDRRRGWELALQESGLDAPDALLEAGDWTRRSGEDAAARLLTREPDIDALFIASDLMAAGALVSLAAAGRRVPDDVAIIGYDDSVIARTTDPPLSSVRQPIEGLGAELARTLLRRIDGGPPESTVLPTELVLRASS